MAAVDTNVLVRLLAEDDITQAAAAASFIERGAWVSVVALAETIWVLQSVYGKKPRQIAAAIRMLLNHEALILQDAEAVAAALEQYLMAPAVEFSDCLILELSRRAGQLPLATFDRRFARLPGVTRI